MRMQTPIAFQKHLPVETRIAAGSWPQVNLSCVSIILNLVLLILLCGFLFFYHLDRRDLWSSHEARAAQDAQTMLDDRDWLLPHLYDHKVELQKPPLYYWLVAGISRLRGQSVDIWAVRLPAACAAAGAVLALFL